MANIIKREREPRPVRYSVQLVSLVDEDSGERVARLVKATKLSMAEIMRQVLADALPGLEKYYWRELEALDGIVWPKKHARGRRGGAGRAGVVEVAEETPA